jgi:hypothetical protein
MTDLDHQTAEFNALRAKRKGMTGPTNSAPNSPKAKFIPGAAIAASKAALEARADLAAANRELAATRGKLATAQVALANAARVPSVPPTTAKPAAPVKAASALITASEFAANPPHMTREEFSKLSPTDKTRFSTTGGKLI